MSLATAAILGSLGGAAANKVLSKVSNDYLDPVYTSVLSSVLSICGNPTQPGSFLADRISANPASVVDQPILNNLSAAALESRSPGTNASVQAAKHEFDRKVPTPAPSNQNYNNPRFGL